MAIFGNLNNMALADLLPFISQQRGVMEIFNLASLPRISLYLENGKLSCMRLEDRYVDELRARSVMTELLRARRGAFEFVPGVSPRRCQKRLGWSVDRLLLTAMTTMDEFSEMTDELPHPGTIFRAVGGLRPQQQRLQSFWNSSYNLLQTGASSERLSRELRMPLDHTRFYLHRLRQIGAVEPVRNNSRTAKNSSVAAKLLGALKRRFLRPF